MLRKLRGGEARDGFPLDSPAPSGAEKRVSRAARAPEVALAWDVGPRRASTGVGISRRAGVCVTGVTGEVGEVDEVGELVLEGVNSA